MYQNKYMSSYINQPKLSTVTSALPERGAGQKIPSYFHRFHPVVGWVKFYLYCYSLVYRCSGLFRFWISALYRNKNISHIGYYRSRLEVERRREIRSGAGNFRNRNASGSAAVSVSCLLLGNLCPGFRRRSGQSGRKSLRQDKDSTLS